MQPPARKAEREYIRSMLEIEQVAQRTRREFRVWKAHLSSPRTNVSQVVDQNGRRPNAMCRLSALTDYYKSLEVRSLAIEKRGAPQENLPGAFSIEDAIEHVTTQHGVPAITSTETADCWLHRLVDAVQEVANIDEAFVRQWEDIITARMEYVQKRAQQIVDDHDYTARPSRQHLSKVGKDHEGAVHVFKQYMSMIGIHVPRQTRVREHFQPTRPNGPARNYWQRRRLEEKNDELGRVLRQSSGRQIRRQLRITAYFRQSGRLIRGGAPVRGSLSDAFDWDGTGFANVGWDADKPQKNENWQEGCRVRSDVSTIQMKITDFYVEGDESLEGDLMVIGPNRQRQGTR